MVFVAVVLMFLMLFVAVVVVVMMVFVAVMVVVVIVVLYVAVLLVVVVMICGCGGRRRFCSGVCGNAVGSRGDMQQS